MCMLRGSIGRALPVLRRQVLLLVGFQHRPPACQHSQRQRGLLMAPGGDLGDFAAATSLGGSGLADAAADHRSDPSLTWDSPGVTPMCQCPLLTEVTFRFCCHAGG